jgi:S-layer protein
LTTAANSTLALNVDSLTTTGTVSIDSDITTLNLNGTGTASTINALTAAGVTTLNVTGDAKVTLTGHTLAALETVTVTNTGGADMDGTALAVSTAFTGGAGADAVSVGATTKAITMGGGNDTVVYGGAVGTGGSVDGGDGVDKISMTFAEANAADASAVFNTKFTNFETLNLEDAITGALDIDGLNNASTVILAAGSNGGTLNNLDSGGTVHIKANNAGTLAVNIDGAIAQAADVLNLKFDKTGILTGNTITVANVETINIDGADTASTGGAAAINTVTLTAAAAKTITVTGNNGLNITATGSTAVTTFDASAIVGNSTTAVPGTAATTDSAANLAVTYTSLNGTSGAAVTIKGGAGNDTLTGSATKNDDTITGGAGNDTIQGGSGTDTLDGGAGTGDVVTYADVTAASSHGLANLSGMAINMSAAEVLQSTIASAMGGTVVIGGGAGEAGSALAAGTVGYLSTTAANSTATMVRDTITGFEKVIGSGLADYIVGSASADTITGGLGADYITGGAGADNFVFTSGLTTDTISDYVVGTDNLHVSVSALETAGASIAATTLDLVELQDASATAADDTIVIQEVADQAGGAAVAAAAGANVFVLLSETYANVGAMVDGIETGDHELVSAAGVDVDDAFLAVWSDGTNAYLSIVSVDSGGTADFAATELVGQNLANLGANTSIVAGEFVAGDFAFIT